VNKKMRLVVFFFCYCLFVNVNVMSTEVIYIENNYIKAGIAQNVGGRLVHLSLQGGNNIIKSHSAFHTNAPFAFSQPEKDADFVPYDGVITWLGPQSEWWSKQSLNEERQEEKSIWPPDPFIIYGNYDLIERTDTSFKLKGSYSPVSGVRLIKKYAVLGNKLEMEVIMINESNKELSWDIWTNARFETTTRFFVPQVDKLTYHVEGADAGGASISEQWTDDTFTFKIKGVPDSGNCWRKAYLHPEVGQIVAIIDTTILTMNFDYVQPNNVHPNQGFVEVFLRTSKDESENLLELEHHSAYVTLKPGEQFSKKQSWTLDWQRN